MIKFFLRITTFAIVFLLFAGTYLTYFGLETDKFDNIIQKKANEVNSNIKLEFKKTKIHLSPIDLNLIVKLKNPKILVRKNEIILSKLNILLSLKSFFSSSFLLKKVEISFVENDIKDLTKITRIFVPKIINKKINKIFAKGKMTGEFIIPFDKEGNIGKNYGFSGKVINAFINLPKNFDLKNLTTKIEHTRQNSSNIFNIVIDKGNIFDIDLSNTTIQLKRNNNQTEVTSLLSTKGPFDFDQVQKIFSLFKVDVKNFKNIHGKADLKTNINFKVKKNFTTKDLIYSIEGKIPYAEIFPLKKRIIKEYLPDFNDEIIIKDSKIKLIKKNLVNKIELNGFLKVKENFDTFDIKQIYDNNKKTFNIISNLDLTSSKVKISKLNYTKDSGRKSDLKIDLDFMIDKYYNINNLTFLSDQSKIYLNNLKLNKKFETNDFKSLEIKTFKDGIQNNDFLIKKSNIITVSGKVFDAQPLLKSLYKKDDRKTFSKKFNSQIKINLSKVITGTNDDIVDFGMISTIKKGAYDKLSLKGNYSASEILEMSIYQIDKDKKTLHIISDRARPFVKNFDFVEGFEGGKLEYESIISKEISNTNLLITDFKVSKVPALAKLLTLASLQGIADTLSGEGIRFDSFEMKTNSKANVMNIEDALAIGPAVSILLEGYVDKGKTVSLRGTLVPATKLNSIIASIPVVGDILVGKKTGEGIVGVSFKMKGPPKDIKTTVNPIKTLTPRFIVRAVEKMKKKKEKSK